jgi:diguanylate cyclase (GGDEF)-like protein
MTGTNYDKKYISGILENIYSEMPDIKIVGNSSRSGIINGEIIENSVILSFSFFEESEISILEIDFSTESIDQITSDLLNQFSTAKNIAGVQLIATVASHDISAELLEKISKDIDFPVFGGHANLDEFSPDENSVVFSKKIFTNGMIAVIYQGKNLHIFADHCLGWIPLGKEMTITEVDHKYCVSQIDGLPAVSIYEKYLNVLPDQHFAENTCVFPILLIRNGEYIARVPYNYDETGKIYFNSDIYLNEKIRLSYGNNKYVVKQSIKLLNKMRSFGAQAIFLYSCVNRFHFFLNTDNNDTSIFKNISVPSVGFFSAGEIIKNKGKGGVLNTSLVAVGLREGPVNKDNRFYLERNNEEQTPIPYIDRLVSFLEATTEELNNSRKKLKRLAIHDSLTKLINRRIVEDTIEYEMKQSTRNNYLSLIMIDVDFFKDINDTYGHDVGDTVLIHIAKLIQNSIRTQDSVGRWGGEEFMVVLPDTECKDALEVAERIRSTIDHSEFETLKNITVSLGVTEKIANEGLQEFYHRVDQALYIAKRNGRNRVEYL